MAETILVIAEQREGKLNRVSFETLTGAQLLGKQTGWTVEAAVDWQQHCSGCRRGRKDRGRQGVRHRRPGAGAVHTRWLCGRAEEVYRRQQAEAGAAAAHLSGARLRAEARRRAWCGAGERRGGLQVRGRKAALHAADVPGEVCRRCFAGGRRAVVCELPDRRVIAATRWRTARLRLR